MNPVLHEVDANMVRNNFVGFEGETGKKVWGHSAVICTNTAEPIEVPFGLWARIGPKHLVLHEGSRYPMGKGNSGG